MALSVVPQVPMMGDAEHGCGKATLSLAPAGSAAMGRDSRLTVVGGPVCQPDPIQQPFGIT